MLHTSNTLQSNNYSLNVRHLHLPLEDPELLNSPTRSVNSNANSRNPAGYAKNWSQVKNKSCKTYPSPQNAIKKLLDDNATPKTVSRNSRRNSNARLIFLGPGPSMSQKQIVVLPKQKRNSRIRRSCSRID